MKRYHEWRERKKSQASLWVRILNWDGHKKLEREGFKEEEKRYQRRGLLILSFLSWAEYIVCLDDPNGQRNRIRGFAGSRREEWNWLSMSQQRGETAEVWLAQQESTQEIKEIIVKPRNPG